jgi:signal transduction histidine kinase
VLTDRGLRDALNAVAYRAAVPVDLAVDLPAYRVPIPIEAAAYFTVCEALTNVSKYADATRAWVHLARHDSHLDVEVGDDGIGGADVASGSGLLGLRDRIAAVNGTLTIDSRPATGTILRARLPLG